MKAIIALEELIKEDEVHIKLVKKQLADHESGENKLSNMIKATAETSLEEANERLTENRAMLAELLKQDIQELEKQEKLKEAIKRKNYYHYQKIRLKRDKHRSNDEKIEAMMIIDELPVDVGFEDDELFRVAEQSIKLHLSLHERLDEILQEIKVDFDKLIKDIKGENISDLGLLNYQIPVVTLQLSTLVSNIKENYIEDEKDSFPGFPKYEDWWIKELWINHQAYFGLYKWKNIIASLCRSSDQQRAWEVIFANWLSIKKQINAKGALGFEYNYAFDTLIRNHSEVEEELATTCLESMESIINQLTAKEDFETLCSEDDHELVTKYTIFKRAKIDYKDVKGKE